MDDGVVPENTTSNNVASKLLCNVRNSFNSHTTWNDTPGYRVSMKLKTLMSNDTINEEHTLVTDSRQVPLNKSVKFFHQNIRGLGKKSFLLMSFSSGSPTHSAFIGTSP